MMQPETALWQRLAPRWRDRPTLLINPPDGPEHFAGSRLAGVLQDDFSRYRQWQPGALAAPVRFGAEWPGPLVAPDTTAILFLPKSKQRFAAQLQLLHRAMPDSAGVAVIGANKAGIKSAAGIMRRYCDGVHKLDAARHCQALAGTYRAGSKPVTITDLFTDWPVSVAGLKFEVHTLPGVFAGSRLDAGSRLLLQTLADRRSSLPECGRALDFGCGCAVLARGLHLLQPGLRISAVDNDAWALAAAEKTLAGLPDHTVRALANPQDIDGRFDLVISNPPFHQGIRQTTAITTAFLERLPALLADRGQCWLVANRFLPYEKTIQGIGLMVWRVAATPAYKVLRVGPKSISLTSHSY